MDPISAPTQPRDPGNLLKLREASEKLEAAFLSEMLKSAGIGRPVSLMGGGIGEEQYSSFLRDEYAQALANSTDFGLAEIIFQSLVGKDTGF
ncbi:MAG: rod-binding protein [Pseudomonadota bacterium]